MSRYFTGFPIILASLGVVIHLLALFGISVSQTSDTIHIVMFIVDSCVVIGLTLKKLWGYIGAVLLFLQQSLFQSYWAYKNMIYGWDLWSFQVITSVLCIIALLILIFSKRHYLEAARAQ
jgi:hypothetical protein